MAVSLGKLCLRNISTFRVLRDSLAEPLPQQQLSHGHSHDYKLWRRLFFFICCPAMVLASVNVMLEEEEPLPEFKKYPHLRIRKKPFPWGDGRKSLFHNPHRNALPDGYEHQ